MAGFRRDHRFYRIIAGITADRQVGGMRNIKLIIAYDGTDYHGFQRQKNAVTVQEVLEEQLSKIFGHGIKLNAAGRTDTGVHAFGQVVNFMTDGRIPADKIPLAAKGVLPADIVVRSAEIAGEGFHARKSAVSKIYCYQIYQEPVCSPFFRNYAWQINQPLDIGAMHQAAQILLGTHDFSAFRAAGGETINPVRTILMACCKQTGSRISFSLQGTGFLYHMVRNIVGTLIDVGLKRMTVNDFAAVLAGRDRKAAGITAPPQGLYLKEVFY
ncbi:MAG: tRNA pseudouridine(38-40) synthase TruA [Veillonellales bacterium]